MSPALIMLIGQLAPIAVGWTTQMVAALIKAISNASKVDEAQIAAVFLPLHQHASLTDLEKQEGVVVNPDGSVGIPPLGSPTGGIVGTPSTPKVI